MAKLFAPHMGDPHLRKRKRTPHKRFSKMIFRNAKTLEGALLAEPHVAVMFPCRTLTRSAKVSCRTVKIAEPKAMNSEKDHPAEPWNAGSFRKCPTSRPRDEPSTRRSTWTWCLLKENHARSPCGLACCGLVCRSPCGSAMC